MIIFPTLKIAYANIPKVASTSLYQWFYQRLYGKPFNRTELSPDKRFWIHGYFSGNHCEHAYREADPAAAKALDGYYVFAVTRDPMRRFISMYGNRVLYHKGLSRKALMNHPGLRPRPDINVLVRDMGQYFSASYVIHYHALPMIHFLGEDMSVYHRLYDISEMDRLMADVNAHIDATGFRTPGTVPQLGRHQSKGRKFGLEVLAPGSFEKLVGHYRRDYEVIPTVSLETTRRLYEQARAAKAEGRLPVEPGVRRGRGAGKRGRRDNPAAA
jgi:hypothetical protein